MNIKFIALLICFCFCISTTIAQTQKSHIHISDKGYIWNDEYYKFSEMEHIFQSDDNYAEKYIRSKKSSTNGNAFGAISLILLPTSLILEIIYSDIDFDYHFFAPNPQSSSQSRSPDYSASAIVFYTSIFTGTIGTIYLLNGKKLKKSLIKDYNNQLKDMERQKDNIEVSFGSTQHGVGFVLRF